MAKKKPGLLSSPLFLLLAPSVLLVAVYYLVAVPLLNSMSSAESSKQFALEQQRVVDERLSALLTQLQTVATSPRVIEVLEQNNPEEIEYLNQHWRPLFNGADRLAILPYNYLGHAGMGEMGAVLKNNIERDLISQAVKKREALLDLYLIDGAPVLSVVAPVSTRSTGASAGNSETKLGAVFLSLTQDWLWSLMAQPTSGTAGVTDNGVVSRLVLTGATLKLLASSGSETEIETKADAVVPLLSLPQVNVEVSRSAISITAPLMGAAIVAACAVLTLVGLSLPKRKEAEIVEKLNGDADKLTQYIASSLRDKVIEPKLEFDANRDMAQSLRKAIEQFKVDTEVQGSLQQQLDSSSELSLDELVNERDSSEETEQPVSDLPEEIDMPAHIFRAYDVRGRADADLTGTVVSAIAKAFASTVREECGSETIVVGRDGRLSSDRIAGQVIDALQSTGCDVIDIGLVPTPVTYHAAIQHSSGNGIMVTASHNPPEDNGLKFLCGGHALSDEEIQQLRVLASTNQITAAKGSVSTLDAIDDYVDAISDDVVFASPTKLVIDCGNGAASEIAPILFASLGAEVIPLYAEVDGNFPNRSPATRPADLQTLCQEVVSQGAELGIAFDGDADRLVAVTPQGKAIKGDHLLMLFAKDVLTRNPGADVVFDVKCSKALTRLITGFGGRPVMARSGHSWVKQAMRESSALLGGEFTGHYMFNERWFGFDDGLYAAARLIELLTLEGKTLDEALEGIPTLVGTDEIEIEVEDSAKFDIVKQFAASPSFTTYDKSLLDGVRVDFSEGWGLLRASNTGAKLVARFEAETEQQLEEIVSLFDSALKEVNPGLGVHL